MSGHDPSNEAKPLSVLFICNKSPWPAHEGGPIAMNNLIEGLADAGHHVKVLAINTNKYSVNPDDIPARYKEKTRIELVYIDLSIRPLAAFVNLFSKKSYHVERFISKAFDKKLKLILTQECFDIVQIETLFMSPYLNTIRKYSEAKIVLRAHNIEHLIWKRVADITGNPFKRAYLRHLAFTLEMYEKQVLKAYDGIIPISPVDAGFFLKNTDKPVLALPTGINPGALPSLKKQNPEMALFHIGAMNWMPNQEGIKWFIDEVWPLVQAELPEIKLYLAGRHMPDWLAHLSKNNLIVVGEVQDAYEFIQSKTISIAPLFSGSGIRIKIIESMAMGKAVVSTSIGAEGINYTDGENMLIADTADAFAKTIKTLCQHPDYVERIGLAARKLILEEHNTSKIIQQLLNFYQHIL